MFVIFAWFLRQIQELDHSESFTWKATEEWMGLETRQPKFEGAQFS